MSTRSDSSRGQGKKPSRVEKTIREWEEQYPGTWILLEVTGQENGEPVRARLITTGQDPEAFHDEWKSHREKKVLTMVTYGPPLEPGPAVVVSAA